MGGNHSFDAAIEGVAANQDQIPASKAFHFDVGANHDDLK